MLDYTLSAVHIQTTMDSRYDSLDDFFTTPRKPKNLNKYAILLIEQNPENGDAFNGLQEPCSLASELLPLQASLAEDLVQIIGEVLQSKIKAHDEVADVPIFNADLIIKENSETLVPVMYRIAAEHFAKANKSKFKIIECRNVTKLVSDWKPSLPDTLIACGHQVIVVNLEESFVPYNDFAFAILRQFDKEWKNRLPRSFFFPDDVCKVAATEQRDLCVVSPSMPDGDLDINKKLGQLNYELLMMIKSSCMSAMKNYLMKRDLRVGKFSDTLDGVAALRQLYRKLQQRLKSGQAIELGSNSFEDIRKLLKQSSANTEIFTPQTWVEYGKRIGLEIPASASSSATSIHSASRAVSRGNCSDEEEANRLFPNKFLSSEKTMGTKKSKKKLSKSNSSTNLIHDKRLIVDSEQIPKEHTVDHSAAVSRPVSALPFEEFTKFKESVNQKYEQRHNHEEFEDDDFSDLNFSADSIIEMLQSSATA